MIFSTLFFILNFGDIYWCATDTDYQLILSTFFEEKYKSLYHPLYKFLQFFQSKNAA